METTIEIIRWGIAIVLGAIFISLGTFNWWAGWRELIGRSPNGVSVAPMIGGLCGLVGIAIVPIDSITTRLAFAWIPLVLDYGTIPYLVGGLVYAGVHRYR